MLTSFLQKKKFSKFCRLFGIDSGKTTFRLSQVATKYILLINEQFYLWFGKEFVTFVEILFLTRFFGGIGISSQFSAWLVRDLLQPDGRISNSDWIVNSFIMFVCEKFLESFLGHQILTELFYSAGGGVPHPVLAGGTPSLHGCGAYPVLGYLPARTGLPPSKDLGPVILGTGVPFPGGGQTENITFPMREVKHFHRQPLNVLDLIWIFVRDLTVIDTCDF